MIEMPIATNTTKRCGRPTIMPIKLRHAIWKLGAAHRDCWQIPGTDAAIYVGTRNQRHGYGHIEAAHSIVIKPGRAPSECELDMIVVEAIAAIAPAELLMAA